MKIVCSKNELQKAINIVSKAVPVRTTMTILECILVDCTGSRILFTANDMDLGIETVVSGVIEERGKVALDAKIFSEIIRKLPDGEVIISCDEKLVTSITCEMAHFQFMGKDGDEFAALPVIEKTECVKVSQFSLREIIRQTIFSISANDTNKVMTGEYFEIKEGWLRVVSLDGHRVSIRRIELREPCRDVSAIVPGKTLQEISKILAGGTEDIVSMYFTKNHVMFMFDETVVVSRLIEGKYFRVDHMISGDYETKIRINRRMLLDSIDRSTLLVREDDKKPIILNIQDEAVELKMQSQIGSMSEQVSIEKEGKDLMIGFNPKFMMDALKVIDDEKVEIYFMNMQAPCFIRNEEAGYVYMVLPVNFVY